MKTKTKVVLLRIPEKLLAEIDNEVKKGFYSSRAEFIKDKVRDAIEQKGKREPSELKKLAQDIEEAARGHLRAYGVHK